MRIKLIVVLILFSNGVMLGQVVEPLGNGLTMRGIIHDIAIDQQSNRTYVVGNFSGISGIEMSKVGFKENGQWQPVLDPSEIIGNVYCAEVYNGVLYIGGNFTISSNNTITNLAKLENGAWSDMGINHMSGSIRDLTWFEDELYATGDFRAINGLKNFGIMKFSNGQWEDSGLDSDLNAEGLFVSGNTLYAWGNGFGTSDNNSHTVSIFTNNNWISLPNLEIEPSISSSCIKHQGKIYSTINNGLYTFNLTDFEWELLTILPSNSDSPILFEHQNELYLGTDGFSLYHYSNGVFDQVNIDPISGDINSIAILNDDIIIGGDFQHWPSKSISIAKITNEIVSTFGQVSSNSSHRDAWNYSVGRSIVKYNNKFLIAGRFSFADNIFSPNLTYWDGVNFSPFEVPVPDGIRQLELFENELYALPHGNFWTDPQLAPYKLIKYNGNEWEGVSVPIGFDEIITINDKLFINNDSDNISNDGGPYYLQNGAWRELKSYPITGQIPWYRYGNINQYQDGYIMTINHWPEGKQLVYLPNDSSDWEIMLDTIEVNFNKINTLEEKIYLINEWPHAIYSLNNNQLDTIALDIENESAHFFKMEEQEYFSAWNGSLYRVNDSLEYYNLLRVRDLEKVADGKYLVALQSGGYVTSVSRLILNNIGIISFEPLNVEINQDQYNICQKNYVEYWPSTDHLNVKLKWEFEGGTPSTSNSYHPMVRYDTSGFFQAKLLAYNIDGDTTISFTQVEVNTCDIPTPIANNHDNHWIMGYEFWDGVGLGGFDFTFADTILAPRYLSSNRLNSGSTVMSDQKGNLQFYSNGISILNMNNQPIEGSECFNSNLNNYSLDYFISNQSILSLPDVEDSNLYHIFDIDPFTIPGEYWLAGSNLSITTIDMSKNNGLGEVISCNEPIIQDILLNSTLQATKHANGKDWWIIVGKYQSDEYYQILFTENGVESVERLSWELNHSSLFSGQSTFSPDGTYFAQIIKENEEIGLWKFDNSIGELYDYQMFTIATIDEDEHPYGCSFSPNSRFLYISSLTQLRQLDLCNYNELQVELIDTWDGTYEFIYPLFFGKQMMTPDHKIIVTPYGNGHMSFGVIEEPNQKGTNCTFNQHALKTHELTRNIADVIPIFPHFRNYSGYEGECISTTTDQSNIENSLRVYPNPIVQNSIVHFNKRINGEIYSIDGKLISSFTNTNYLDLYSLPSGIYFIKSEEGINKIIVK